MGIKGLTVLICLFVFTVTSRKAHTFQKIDNLNFVWQAHPTPSPATESGTWSISKGLIRIQRTTGSPELKRLLLQAITPSANNAKQFLPTPKHSVLRGQVGKPWAGQRQRHLLERCGQRIWVRRRLPAESPSSKHSAEWALIHTRLYLVVFMFYMNNSNLLIRITELSIEKVSNRIQTTQALRQVSREIHRNSSAYTHFGKDQGRR